MHADLISNPSRGALSAELVSGILSNPAFLKGLERFIEARIERTISNGLVMRASLMAPAEVCEHLNVCLSTLDKLVDSGKLRCARIGGQRRFSVEDVDAYVRDCTRRP